MDVEDVDDPIVPGLAGRRVLVVGASAGIGRGIATAAVSSGAAVVFASRRPEALAEAVERAGGGTPIAVDVRDEDRVAQLLSQAAEALGGLDAFVYATGYSSFGLLEDLTADAWRAVLETNLVGAALVGRHAIPHLAASGGVGFFLSSESVGRPRPGLVHYSASSPTSASHRSPSARRSERSSATRSSPGSSRA